MRESCNTAVGTAILFLAVCVCDMVNKSSMCGGSAQYIVSQSFSALLWQRGAKMTVPLGAPFGSRKLLVKTVTEQTIQSLHWEIFAPFWCFRPACIFA